MNSEIDMTHVPERPKSSYATTLQAIEQVMAILRNLTPDEKRKLVLAINALVGK